MDYLIFLFAFILRLFSLNQSLWLDEATTAQVLKAFPFVKIVSSFSITDFHPPLYYLVMKLWTNLFGYTEIALRLPSVIFSLLTGWIIYKLLGRWAAVLFLFNPLIIYYSQEARMYSMVTFLLFLGYYFVHQIVGKEKEIEKKQSKKLVKNIVSVVQYVKSYNPTRTHYVIFANICIFLSFLTFYGSLFFILTLYLYLLLKKQYRLLTLLFPGFLLSLVIIYPLLMQQLAHAKAQLLLIPNWGAVLGGAEVKNVLLIPIKFLMGRISWEPKWKYYVAGMFWLSLVTILVFRSLFQRVVEMSGVKKSMRDQYNSLLFEFSFFLFAPLILGYLFSFYKPMMQYFRFLYVVPFMILVIAYVLRRTWQKAIIFAGFIFFSALYLFYPLFHREDWKGILQGIPKNTVVYMIPSSSDPVGYYRPDLKVSDIRSINAKKNKSKSIYIIPYTTEIYGVQYRKALSDGKYILKAANSSRGIIVEQWNR